MRVARYVGGGNVAIVEEPEPNLPEGGLLVRTEACGLCSGELMDWYMDRKIPHVLGHEVAGRVVASEDDRFPVGTRVFPHHHAPCLQCSFCRRGLHVHCETWRRTKLTPGGMADLFAVGAANLADTLPVDDLRAEDAALIEPLACVVKSLRRALGVKALGVGESDPNALTPQGLNARSAVIGLGVMGLMHMLLLPPTAVGYDVNPARVQWAKGLGLDARHPDGKEKADVVIVCPGSQAALDLALEIADPGATVLLFAPFPPGVEPRVPWSDLYFKDITLANSYSCGPDDTRAAAEAIRAGRVRAEQVVSDFVAMEDLPAAYQAMKRGEILKAMVVQS